MSDRSDIERIQALRRILLEGDITERNAPALAYLNRFQASSRKTNQKYLGMIIDLLNGSPAASKLTSDQLRIKILSFDWSRLDVHLTNKINRLALERKYSQSTRNSLLCCCRGVAKQRWMIDQISKEEFGFICEVGKTTRKRGKRKRKSKAIDQETFARLLGVCDRDKNKLLGLRDRTILILLYGSGLRAQEAIGLRSDQVDFEAQTITIRGKGDNERIVCPVEGVLSGLARWLEAYSPVERVLFVAFSKNDGAPIEARRMIPLSYTALYEMLRKRSIQAGLAQITPHCFRHSFVTNTYLATEDLFCVQLQVGHSNQATTKGYVSDIAEEKAKRKAARSWKIDT